MNGLRTTFFLTLLTLLLVFAGQAMGGSGGAMTALIMAILMNGVSYFFSDKIVLRMYNAKQVTESELPQVYNLVADLAMRGGMPMPKVYLIESPALNAFATGRDPHHAAVAVTTGIVKALNREELTGVLGHELSHVQNRDILIGSIAATVAGAISMLANMAQWAMIFGGGRHDDRDREEGGGSFIGPLAMMIVAPIAAMLIQMAISRSREYEADAGGARLCGNPLWLASALRKLHAGAQSVPMDANPATAHMFIVNPLTGGGLLALFSTHPPMEERVARLEAMAYGQR
jgi:heat shock protein HtpX